jgi:hypothetical protein
MSPLSLVFSTTPGAGSSMSPRVNSMSGLPGAPVTKARPDASMNQTGLSSGSSIRILGHAPPIPPCVA